MLPSCLPPVDGVAPRLRNCLRPQLRLSAHLALALASPLWAQTQDRAALVASLDSAIHAHVANELVPGVSVAVVHRGDTLILDGYGYADLEFDVQTPDRAVYQIGSMTKQFTAAAVLQLVEQGKLDLEADVKEYLPDFDTQGYDLPVRRLLDHTSGMKGYTEMRAFGDLRMQDLPRDTMLRLVEQVPFEFDPGYALIYNNSAFFLLGLIVEKVSGQPYEQYVKEHLFEPTGMADSYYCDERAVVKNRAHGYDRTPNGLAQAAYLDHTWPYAAGSLCSTAWDLIAWNDALHGGEVLSEASYHDMITPDPLEDGTLIRYAMGLNTVETGGRRTIAHGGGINGFLSQGFYFPDDELVVIVLQNSTGPNPGALAQAIIRLVLGPGEEPATQPFTGDLSEFVGEYSGPSRGRTMTVEVSADGDQLVLKVNSGQNDVRPGYQSGLRWVLGTVELTFERAEGRVVLLRFDSGGGHYVLRRVAG